MTIWMKLVLPACPEIRSLLGVKHAESAGLKESR